jgi:hypothetical protein
MPLLLVVVMLHFGNLSRTGGLVLVPRDKTYSKSQYVTNFTLVHAVLRAGEQGQAIR